MNLNIILALASITLTSAILAQKNNNKTDSLLTVFSNPKTIKLRDILQKDAEHKGVVDNTIKDNIGNMPIKKNNINTVEKMPVRVADASIVYSMPIATGNAGSFDINKVSGVSFNGKDTIIYYNYKKP